MTDAIILPKNPRFNNLEGQTFGRLRVISYAGKSRSKNSQWNCRCECGAEKVIQASSLRTNLTKSCGCLRSQRTASSNKKRATHGKTGTPEHYIWDSMLQRCCNPKCKNYERYGKRGITVCVRWKTSFENFLSDMGERPSPEHSIDREDNDGGYCPENCRWATRKQQARNKRNSVLLTAHGRTQAQAAWAEELGICSETIAKRIKLGWPLEKALCSDTSRGRRLTFKGKTQTVPVWAEELGISRNTIHSRLRRGWSTEKALSTKYSERAAS